MSEELLDGIEVGAVVEHVGREGMSQDVGALPGGVDVSVECRCHDAVDKHRV